MAQSLPNSSNPHLLPPDRPPCPTCSCPLSHFQQPPAPSTSSGNKKMEVTQSPPASSISSPKHPQAFSILEAMHFPQPKLQPSSTPLSQPQLPPAVSQPPLSASSIAPTPVSAAAPAPNLVTITTAPAPPPVASSLLPSQANAPDSPNPTCVSESFIYKNRLQEYSQRSSIPLPEYRTVNEGSQHAPRFRSSVTFDGIAYTSPNTFSNRKAAEQDVAKLAMECISKKIKEECPPLIRADAMFCKSILNEFAVKMNLPKPTYNIVQPKAVVTVYVSSLVFNGVTYTGDPGTNKKKAEQLAAHAAILLLMGDSGFGTALSEIINSKGKLFDAFYKGKELSHTHDSVVPVGVNARSDIHTQDQVVQAYVPTPSQQIKATQEASVLASSQPMSATQEVSVHAPSQPTSAIAYVPIASPSIGAIKEASVPSVNQPIRAFQGPSVSAMSVIPEAYIRAHPPCQEWRVPKQEILSSANSPLAPPIQQPFILSVPPAPAQQQPLISSVPPAPAQQPSLGVVPTIGKKRHRKKNKRGNKKVQVGMQ